MWINIFIGVGLSLVAALLFVAIDQRHDKPSSVAPIENDSNRREAMRTAALDALYWRIPDVNEVGVELGMDDMDKVQSARTQISVVRTWLKDQPRDVQGAYEYWLDYYESNADEAERAIRDGARQKWLDKCKKDDAEYQQKKQAARAVQLPRMPK